MTTAKATKPAAKKPAAKKPAAQLQSPATPEPVKRPGEGFDVEKYKA